MKLYQNSHSKRSLQLCYRFQGMTSTGPKEAMVLRVQTERRLARRWYLSERDDGLVLVKMSKAFPTARSQQTPIRFRANHRFSLGALSKASGGVRRDDWSQIHRTIPFAPKEKVALSSEHTSQIDLLGQLICLETPNNRKCTLNLAWNCH